ncbi:MAG: hypothetical protein A3J66_03145 [Candidatus Magasanikbacteria bacterium RIFCSPHIGHO2_02_FULL_47_14]|uniref:Methyltransferase domain-containing protein n=1 Tax=Candidatus Magasanikbacteria bacterium RIFCSPHIGHO2_02_FULL_47_14 TaxID=1798680 RepID=A0A1F6MAB9_9BACT|nr:MAG: hypothetical protein A3J66_03145 [Candidatus Magasanikbacteria bacterium RIFCSPHIGHO2_02_FULL_47_14]
MNTHKLFDRYISTHFGYTHSPEEIQREYKVRRRYFRKNYASHLPKNKNARIVDAGCGMGDFLFFLQREGYTNFLGVDISTEVVSFCQKQGFATEQHDLHSFFHDRRNEFDAIVFNDIIEHLTKDVIVELLEKMFVALRPGGVLCIKTPNMSNWMTAAGGRYIDFTHEIGFTQESLSQVARLAGFSDVTVYGLAIYVFYENPLNYPAWLLSMLIQSYMLITTRLYGRKTTTIFSKDILVICKK